VVKQIGGQGDVFRNGKDWEIRAVEKYTLMVSNDIVMTLLRYSIQ